MAVEGTFDMDIMAGLIGDKIYGGTAEWDDSLSAQDNIYRAMGYDPISGSFSWDYSKMPTFQSLIPIALQNIRDNQWKTAGSQQGSKWTIGGNINFYFNMVTNSWVMPVEDNWNYPVVGYGDYTYRLDFNYQGVGMIVFNSTAFAMQEGKTILGYDVEHTVPLQTFNETNGYQSLDPDVHHNRYYADPNLSPSGLLLFYEVIDGENVPTKMYFVSIHRGENLEGTPTLFSRQISDEILTYVNMEEEEEEMVFPDSCLCNFFTTMYAMTYGQVEGLAKYLVNPKNVQQGDKTAEIIQRLLDDMGFQTGVVTDGILDMTIYPFSIPNTMRDYAHYHDYDKTRYLKLGYGNDKTNLGPEGDEHLVADDVNRAIFYYDPEDPGNTESNTILYKIRRLNTVPLTIPSNGSINFDSRVTRFNDFRDYPPYRTFEMYVPFVGTVPVDQRKLYGKQLQLRYIPDFYTGNGTCLLLSDDGGGEYSILETWDCVLGVHQAVTTTNWAEYASRMNSARSLCSPNPSNIYANQINTQRISRQPVMPTKDNLARTMAMQSKRTSIAMSEQMGGVIRANYVVDAGLSGMQHAQAEVANQGVFTGNVNGTSSASNNYFMPLYWVIFDYQQESHISENLNSLMGRASDTSGTINSFTGYLQVKAVDLICSKATDSEKSRIMSLLESGIRI